MREAGVLEAVAQLAADQAQALVDTSPTMETVQSLWRLERYVFKKNYALHLMISKFKTIPDLREYFFALFFCSALVVLEHSCFALTENEIHLIEMEVTQGVPPMLVRMSLAQWMVQQVQALSRQTVVSGLKKVS